MKWEKGIVTEEILSCKGYIKGNSEIPGRIPLGRWAEPEDLMGAAVFLASDASDYITGQTIFCRWRLAQHVKNFRGQKFFKQGG